MECDIHPACRLGCNDPREHSDNVRAELEAAYAMLAEFAK